LEDLDMNAWKTAALAAVVVAAAGIGAAMAPVAHGQRVVAPRAVDVFAGHGSQIGVSIRDLSDDDKSWRVRTVRRDARREQPDLP